jgi:hypothetical protein
MFFDVRPMRAFMKHLIAGTAVLALGAGCQESVSTTSARPPLGGNSTLEPDPAIPAALFFDDLAPYGEWIDEPEYGWIWCPADVAADWRPYVDGRWVYTNEFGWTWVGAENWAWAPYHYGRWTRLGARGWAWVPGREWAPAWVAWRSGNGYVGWAPLPPASQGTYTFDVKTVHTADVPARDYAFVPAKFVMDERVKEHVLPAAENGRVFSATVDSTDYERVGGRIVNRGVDVARIEGVIGRKVTTFTVTDAKSPGAAVLSGRTLAVYHPKITSAAARSRRLGESAARPAAVRSSELDDGPRARHVEAPSDLDNRDFGGNGPGRGAGGGGHHR